MNYFTEKSTYRVTFRIQFLPDCNNNNCGLFRKIETSERWSVTGVDELLDNVDRTRLAVSRGRLYNGKPLDENFFTPHVDTTLTCSVLSLAT